MGLNGAIIKSGASGFTVTAGTDLTFQLVGTPIPGGAKYVATADSDFRTQRSFTVRGKDPVSGGGLNYSKDKKSIVFQAPKLVSNNTAIANNLVRLERECHPESTAAEKLELLYMIAQMAFDTDFQQWWVNGSIA